MQLAWKSEDRNLGMFSPQQALSKQHCLPRVHPILLQPHTPSRPRLSTGNSNFENMDLSHRVAVSRSKRRQEVPRQGVGCEHPLEHRGWERRLGWAASNQLGTLPWVLSLAQNCREEKERPQRRKTPHRVRAKQEDNKQEEPRRGEPATTRLSEGPDTRLSQEMLVWEHLSLP